MVGQLVMIDGDEYKVTRIGTPCGVDTVITVVNTHGYPVGQRMTAQRLLWLMEAGRCVIESAEEEG